MDCNIYLDVASVVGEPFHWEEMTRANARIARDDVPHPDGRHYDSLRAVALCTSGRLAANEPLEVWTCTHIDQVVAYKAEESTTPHPTTGHKGLGWSRAAAQQLVPDLVHRLTQASNGGTLGSLIGTDSSPPLDHEDGCVFRACAHLRGADPLAKVYCITRDGGFLGAYQRGDLSDHTVVMSPTRFVAVVRAARASVSLRGMPPPPGLRGGV